MAHNISRTLMWLFTFSLTIAQKHIQIPTRYNCKYKQTHILHALTYLSLKTNYANNGLKQLTKQLQKTHHPKHKTNHKSPDSDTFLYRLNQIPRTTLTKMLNNLNRDVLLKAKTKGAFTKKVTLAIDLTCLPYYGKMTNYVNGGKPKQATSYFHTWATLRIVTKWRRFTLKAIPIKRGCLDAEAMAKTVVQLLAEAKKIGLKVDFVLLDKGFCWKEILQQLDNSGYKYIVALKKTDQVKDVILDYFKTRKGRVRKFSKGEGKNKVCFNVTIHRFKKQKQRRRKVGNIVELYGVFATNLSFRQAEKLWSKISDLYRRRWGIESGYRVDKSFRALTTSRNEKLRFVYYYLFMVFLGNLWVLYNFVEAKRDGCVSGGGGGGYCVCCGEFCFEFVCFLVGLGFGCVLSDDG